MEAYFSVTEKEAMVISQKGLASLPSVKLQLADGSIYGSEGTISKMSGVIDAATGSVQLIASLILRRYSRAVLQEPLSFRVSALTSSLFR